MLHLPIDQTTDQKQKIDIEVGYMFMCTCCSAGGTVPLRYTLTAHTRFIPTYKRNICAWVRIRNSEHDSCLQTVVFVDSTEIRYTKMKFILNTFPRCCDG